jgi:uncharacterized protein YdeI (YjbR/CyaY-like superfamily)
MKPEYEMLEFANSAAWRAWLDGNHASCDGLWLRLYKKTSGIASVNYAEALDEALCYGWIDGQKKSYDELSFLQKFTPRRTRSMWSKRNIEHIARLSDSGLMMPAGLAEVERAKLDGRWDAAYDPATSMTIPEDFLIKVRQNPKVSSFFDTLSKTNLYAIGFRLQTAKKPETRTNRMAALIKMLEDGQKP